MDGRVLQGGVPLYRRPETDLSSSVASVACESFLAYVGSVASLASVA